ncbi:MAG: YraN family protein [Microthrixaceae bacterium]|jgi:putative endonuclease
MVAYDSARLGRHGEDRVARWYEQRGYRVLERNWRCDLGELDLILARGSDVVVCEVKTRSTTRFGHPLEAVGLDKQRRLRALAARWRSEAPFRPDSLRIDVAAVLGGRITVVEHAC